MFGRIRKTMSGRERKGMMIGLVVSGVTAWVVYSQPADPGPKPAKRGGGAAVYADSTGTSEPSLNGPGMVAAINVVRPAVFDCYRAEFIAAPHRDQVVIIEFWAQIEAGEGLVFNGSVPFRDSVSESFDGCVKQKLFQLPFESNLPPGRKKITFPFAFALQR